MELEAKLHEIKKPIMVLGTSSGAGKSLTVTAICRILKNLGEEPIPVSYTHLTLPTIVSV